MDIRLYINNLNDDEIPKLMKLGVFSDISFLNYFENCRFVGESRKYLHYIKELHLEESNLILLLSKTTYPSSVWRIIYNYIRPKKYNINYASVIARYRFDCDPRIMERRLFWLTMSCEPIIPKPKPIPKLKPTPKPHVADQLLKQLNRDSIENQKKQKGQRSENKQRRRR